MANCPNCNAPLEDDARFCANCGAAITPAEQAAAPETAAPETIFCPHCGEQTSAAFEYCEHCGADLNASGGQKEKKAGGPGMKKWLICGGIVVIAAALVIVLISIFGGGGGKGYGLYLKEGEMYYSKLSKNGAWQVSSDLYDDAGNRELAYASGSISSWITMSSDGKTLFFPDKLGGGVTLYYRGTSGKKDAVKIDSDISYYAVNDSASLVTYLKNGNLYQYAMSSDEKNKLAGDVDDFYVSDDGKRILFLDDEDTLYELNSGKDKEKLDSDVTIVRTVSDDCKTIIYQKDDILYLMQDGKERVKIASDVFSVIRAYQTGEAYYTERDDDEITLYYFDGKKSEEVTDEFGSSFAGSYKTPVLVYRDEDDEFWLAAGLKTTELDAEDPRGFVFSEDGKSVWYVDEPDKNGEGELYKITISNGTAKKAEKQDDDVYAGYVSYTDGGHLIYFKDVSDYEGELYVDGKKADDDVYFYSIGESDSGALLYFTDYNSNKEYGTLMQYSGGKSAKIADDVAQAYYTPNGSVLYLMDYSTSKYRGDLYVYSGSKSEKLDEDVVAIIPVTDSKYKGGGY